MPNTMNTRAKSLMLVGALVGVTILATSCIPNPFNLPPAPHISVPAGNTYGAPPLDVAFDISGSSDPDGEIVSFTFDFGDGSPQVSGIDLTLSLQHSYVEIGTYFATLTVVDDDRQRAITQLLIAVYEPED